ncbi:MBL fold metallo-hydrolase [Gemmatimonas aurantiaca]|uniref:MBL fold metallo-hydrolase n=1 Tax=Gemmatimonas aurantiaca TaxID=173480 RepID=UPI0018D2AB4A|nr:MBL fold metallo-hydrolase [Gemmatimonas aurantiaca]
MQATLLPRGALGTRGRLRRIVLGRVLPTLLLLALVGAVGLWWAARDALGGVVDGERLTRASQSPQWRHERFGNPLPRVDSAMLNTLVAFAFGGSAYRVPGAPLPMQVRHRADYSSPPATGLRVTWLGHSTMLLEIDGARVLIDPVWGERVSPFSFMGPKRFHAPPLAMSELPDVDVVVISHDHYDHLDMPTVKALRDHHVRWMVPLGVGAHLQAWGIPSGEITELDWWEDARVGDVTLTATPARHFSGRSLGDADRTLWSGWVIATAAHRVFYSGDTAMHEEFDDIGARLGPFDLTMIEAGAYDARWADVHLGPEQAVEAHRLVGGRVLLPVHWGLFDLALHGWTEPIERVFVAAQAAQVTLAMPQPGAMIEPTAMGVQPRWWPEVPWVPSNKAPVISSGLTHKLARAR